MKDNIRLELERGAKLDDIEKKSGESSPVANNEIVHREHCRDAERCVTTVRHRHEEAEANLLVEER